MELTLFRPIAAQAAQAYFTHAESTPAVGGIGVLCSAARSAIVVNIVILKRVRRDSPNFVPSVPETRHKHEVGQPDPGKLRPMRGRETRRCESERPTCRIATDRPGR